MKRDGSIAFITNDPHLLSGMQKNTGELHSNICGTVAACVCYYSFSLSNISILSHLYLALIALHCIISLSNYSSFCFYCTYACQFAVIFGESSDAFEG